MSIQTKLSENALSESTNILDTIPVGKDSVIDHNCTVSQTVCIKAEST